MRRVVPQHESLTRNHPSLRGACAARARQGAFKLPNS